MNRRMVLHLGLMAVMGAMSFAAFGFLVEWRHGQPVDTAAPAADGAPLSVLARGVAASAETSRTHLAGGHRGEAMHALDAAVRASMVGRHAAAGPLRWAFDHGLRQLEEARVDVQIGQPHHARRHLALVIDAMEAAASLAAEPSAGVPPRNDWGTYEGATVLNALGARIGELATLARDGGRVEATLAIGGSRDILGFIDLGGTDVTVDATRLLYGEPGAVGGLHVVVPTYGEAPDDIAR